MSDTTHVDYAPVPHGFTADYVLQVWRRRKWIGLLGFGAGCAATAGVVLSLPNLYRATATVLVDRQEVSEAFVKQSVTAELETRIQMVHQRVTSRERLSDIITRLNLYPQQRGKVPMDVLVDHMKKDVQLHLQGVNQPSGRTATIAFALTYSGQDPKVVADVTNTLAGAYIAENAKSRERQAGETAQFLQQQLDDAQRALQAEEKRVSDYTGQYGTELPQQLEANIASLNRATADLHANQDAQIRNSDRRERILGTPPPVAAAPVQAPPDSREAQLAKARQDLADLQQGHLANYPGIADKQNEIKRLEALGPSPSPDRGRPSGPDLGRPADGHNTGATLTEIDTDLKALKMQESAIRRDVGEYESRIQRAPARQRSLEAMIRSRDSAREAYQTVLKQYTDAKLASNLEHDQSLEQFRVLDPALPPAQPAAPDRVMLALMGLAFAFAVGLGAVIVAEKRDTSFHTAEDLRAFVDLPVLASIRHIVTPSIESRQWWRSLALVCVALVALALIGAGAFYAAAGNEHIVRLTARGEL